MKCLAVCASCAVLGMTPVGFAGTITRSVEFSGPEQTLGVELTSSLDGTIAGGGTVFGETFVLDPNPQAIVTTLNPVVTTGSANPSTTAPAQFTFDDTTGELLDIDNLEMSIFGGQTIPFSYNAVTLDILVNGTDMDTLDVTLVGELKSLNISQRADASFVGSAFSIPIDGEWIFDVSVDLFGGLLTIPIFQDATASGITTITGTSTSTSLPGSAPQDVLIELDGLSLQTIPLSPFSIPFEFTAPDVFVSGQLDVNMEFAVDLDYHLETVVPGVIVPEPSTWTMLFTAGLAMAPLVRRRRRSRVA